MNGGKKETQQQPGIKMISNTTSIISGKNTLGGFLKNATPLYRKWFLPINIANIFRTDIIRNLADLGGIQQAGKELECIGN